MKMLHKLGICAIILIILSFFVPNIFLGGQKEEIPLNKNMNNYNYQLTVVPNTNLTNITLYLPIPIGNNTSYIDQNIIEQYSNDYPSWEFVLVDTEYGQMLSLRTDNITPIFYSDTIEKAVIDSPDEIELTYIESNTYSEETPNAQPIIDLSGSVIVNETINTQNPVGNAAVLMPKYGIIEDGDAEKTRVDMQNHPDAKIYNCNSMIYAQYDATSNAEVKISIYSNGYNEWWSGEWQSNNFRESIIISLSGPQNGWSQVTSELITGEGKYSLI
jgi:hypothetical protein